MTKPESLYDCCNNMQLEWNIPRIIADGILVESICVTCGHTGHVGETTLRKSSAFYQSMVQIMGLEE